MTTRASAQTAPVTIGTRAAGTFADASGHSAQSHLFYAANAGVWWLLTLTSTADSAGGSNHLVKAYHSSGPDLTTATWIAAADSPGALASRSANCSSCSMSGGRALGVAYVNNAPIDVVHAEVAMATDGQNGLVAHIRAKVTATSITWESWNYHDEPAARWTLPRAVSLGVSAGKYIHSASPILQQEVDANVRKSTNPDSASTWTSGFSKVAVVDNSMIHQSNAFAFAPLSGNAMLVLFDDGGGPSCGFNCVPPGSASEPDASNLGYKKSNADGTWPSVPVGSQAKGDGKVFSTSAVIDQNDWTLVVSDTGIIRAFRSNAAATGIDASAYNVASNTWSASTAPPPFAAGQAFKRKAGLFGVGSGANIWLFVVNTDTASSILYTTFDGTRWTPWSGVPGTTTGQHDRRFIAGYPAAVGNQIGLIWTEGATQFDIATTALRLTASDTTPPTVSILSPADGSTVSGPVSVQSTASDDVAVASVQFQMDGVNAGAAQTAAPYGLTWNSTTVANGSHAITAIARDAWGNSSAATATIVVNNPATVPNVVNTTLSAAKSALTQAGLTTGAVTSAANASVPLGSVISQSPAPGTVVDNGTSVDLVVSDGVTVPSVVNETEASARSLIDGVAGLSVGAVTTASSTSVPSGRVISQNPAAAAKVSGGTAVAFVVSSGAASDTTPPTVTSVSPANGVTGVTTSTTVNVTFSEAMTASSITASTVVLRSAAGATIAATVSYNATSRVATLAPSQALAASTSHTFTVSGGSAGVKDAAGNPLAANFSCSWTTAAATGAPVTIWSASAAPSSFATTDRSSVELGLKFTSDVAGSVTGVRFYKGTAMTGAHTGTLWSSTGTKLATATFTGETASGWQQVTFSTPVAITANTVYVVSYHSNVGSYGYTSSAFASTGIDKAPLHALSNSAAGGNGVYRYGSTIAFPNSSFNSTNYWVDVVFVPQ